jgi:hypothetical protein
MTMNVSLRRGPQPTTTIEGAAGSESAQTTQAPRGSQQTAGRTPAREPDVTLGQRVDRQQQRLDRLDRGPSASNVCRATPSEAELVQRYRAEIARHGYIASAPPPAPPPLPRMSGAEIRQRLNIPEPQMPAGHRQLIENGSAPVTGFLMPRIIHAVENALRSHFSSVGHAGGELGVHAASLAAELHHIEHGLHTASGSFLATGGAAARAVAGSLVGTFLTLDTTVGSVIETAIRMNNGTLPTPQGIRDLLIERGPEFVAALRTRLERSLEESFNRGARAAARGEPAPANSDPAFRLGYAAGAEYRRQHGCEFDTRERDLRARNSATRGTAADANQGVQWLTSGPESIAARIDIE